MSNFDFVNLDDVSNAKLQALRSLFVQIESGLLSLADSREKLYAISNLEQSFMWTGKTIAREQEARQQALLEAQRQVFTVPQQQVFTVPQPQQPVVAPKPTNDVAIIAECTAKTQTLAAELQNLIAALPKPK